MVDVVFMFGADHKTPVHAEFVAEAAVDREDAARRIAAAFPEGLKAPAAVGVAGEAVYIDVVVPCGVKLHVVLRPRQAEEAEEADEIYEYDSEAVARAE